MSLFDLPPSAKSKTVPVGQGFEKENKAIIEEALRAGAVLYTAVVMVVMLYPTEDRAMCTHFSATIAVKDKDFRTALRALLDTAAECILREHAENGVEIADLDIVALYLGVHDNLMASLEVDLSDEPEDSDNNEEVP